MKKKKTVLLVENEWGLLAKLGRYSGVYSLSSLLLLLSLLPFSSIFCLTAAAAAAAIKGVFDFFEIDETDSILKNISSLYQILFYI